MTAFIFDLDQVQNHRAQPIVMAFHFAGALTRALQHLRLARHRKSEGDL